MKKVNFGLIGVGNRGVYGYLKTLKEYFPEEARFIALSDSNERRLKKVSEELGGNFRFFSNYKEMLSLPEIDAVVITTPDFTHEEITIDALQAGKHVICEKPLAITAKGCNRVIQASIRAKKILQLGLVLRYSPFYQKLKKLIEKKTIGEVKIISMLDYYSGGKTYFRRWNRFKKNTGGLLIHKGCHAFDILNWLVDSSPERVASFGGLDVFKSDPQKPLRCRDCKEKYTCHGSAFLDSKSVEKAKKMGYSDFDLCLWNSEKDTHDNDTVIIEYKNKVRVNYTECLFPVRSTRYYSIIGDKGEIEADSTSNQIRVYSLSSQDVVTYNIGPSISGHGGGDKILLDDFFNCLREGKEPLANGEAGKLSVLIGLAAEKSIEEKRIIRISEIEDDF